MGSATCSANLAPERAQPVDPQQFRGGMRRLAAGCSIIATGDGSERAGLTATAVCSVSADPPRLLVCVNRSTWTHALITRTQVLSVNLLSDEQEMLAKRFAGMAEGVRSDQRFELGEWSEGRTGAPLLQDALASFDCRVIETTCASTHSMFLCEVIDVRTDRPEGGPLLYFDCGFGHLAPGGK